MIISIFFSTPSLTIVLSTAEKNCLNFWNFLGQNHQSLKENFRYYNKNLHQSLAHPNFSIVTFFRFSSRDVLCRLKKQRFTKKHFLRIHSSTWIFFHSLNKSIEKEDMESQKEKTTLIITNPFHFFAYMADNAWVDISSNKWRNHSILGIK